MNFLDYHTIRAVFLDRDGVLNRKLPEGEYVSRWAQFEWLPGAEEAVRRMNCAGLAVILITNQRGIALGRLSEQQLQDIHTQMQAHLAAHGARLDAIYHCPHDKGECRCRKPEVELFEQALRRFPETTPETSLVIGDSPADIEAGKRLGMRTIFLHGEPDRQKPGAEAAAKSADAAASSLLEAVEAHLGLTASHCSGCDERGPVSGQDTAPGLD